MFSVNLFLVMASATTLSVAQLITRQSNNNTGCIFTMTPTPGLDTDTLQTSINYVVGSTVGKEYPNQILTDDNTLTSNGDGSYAVQSVIAVTGEDGATVGAFVETWAGETLDDPNLQIEWYVSTAVCTE